MKWSEILVEGGLANDQHGNKQNQLREEIRSGVGLSRYGFCIVITEISLRVDSCEFTLRLPTLTVTAALRGPICRS